MNLMDFSGGMLEMRAFRPSKGSTYRLDTANQCLWQKKQRILFDPKAFAVLCVLVKQAGRMVTKDELLDTVWEGEIVCEAVIKFQIQRIRAILQDTPRSPRFIETVHRRGYRFIGRLAVVQPRTVRKRKLLYDFVPPVMVEQEFTSSPY
jgi:DNA-binding winged helix-turn-helix (wHTH) protein